MRVDIDAIKAEICEKLKSLNPASVILFGSHAHGSAADDSDIDLYVITNDDYIPQSWAEKNQIYLQFARQLRSLRQRVPIDLLVHTKKMNKKFVEMDSALSREIMQKGIRLL
ncbi:nucleotidyltransferase domain-containing protein [Desulfurispirillum indicum]|uniref:nucleotidyltransferase domain-containing protein n=1 Tax=Desulfurispirillum indicum TaxID=936456 RepID=UPI003CCE478C